MSLLLGILTFVLVLLSVFLVLVILAQRTKSDGGVGAALGGGMAEAAFGAESGNVLSKATQVSAVAFFVLCFVLYLGRISQHRGDLRENPRALPTMPGEVPAGATLEVPGSLPALPDATAPSPIDAGAAPAPEVPAPAPSGEAAPATP